MGKEEPAAASSSVGGGGGGRGGDFSLEPVRCARACVVLVQQHIACARNWCSYFFFLTIYPCVSKL